MPSGEPASPAYQPEKGVDAYGMDSDFGATPNPGPYPDSEHPATPDEGPASPAYKAAALERKAAKCLRVATAMLGKEASTEDIENQALILMDLPDRVIHASLVRIGKASVKEEEEKAAETLQEEAEDKAAEKSEKKASRLESRIARIERILVKLAGEDGKEEEEKAAESIQEEAEEKAEEKAEKKASRRRRRRRAGWEAMGDEEAMLEQMLVEEGMMPMEEAMLEQMLVEEGMGHDEEAMEEVEGEMLDEMVAEAASEDPGDHDTDESAMGEEDAMEEVTMTDPMGMMTGPMEEDEMMVLAKLFGKTADDDEDDDDDDDSEEEEVEEEEESKKKAALRPQPKKASTGASRLGGVKKEASGEINQLSQLWESAPDVSKFF
jgi:hypothetical protein